MASPTATSVDRQLAAGRAFLGTLAADYDELDPSPAAVSGREVLRVVGARVAVLEEARRRALVRHVQSYIRGICSLFLVDPAAAAAAAAASDGLEGAQIRCHLRSPSWADACTASTALGALLREEEGGGSRFSSDLIVVPGYEIRLSPPSCATPSPPPTLPASGLAAPVAPTDLCGTVRSSLPETDTGEEAMEVD
jgi:hypothetical protein